MKKSALFRIGDLLPVALCLLAAIALPLTAVFAVEADTLRVQTPNGVQTYPLDTDGTIFVNGNNDIGLTILILDGKARVSEADCPDKLCVHTGWLEANGDTAACLPAGVLISVDNRQDSGVDAVAR